MTARGGNLLMVVSGPLLIDDDVVACESVDGARAMLVEELAVTAQATDTWGDAYELAVAEAREAQPPTTIHLGGFAHILTWEH
jgi:hypothetical protein